MTYCLLYGWKNQEGEQHSVKGKHLCSVYFFEKRVDAVTMIGRGEAEGEWHPEAIVISTATDEGVERIKEEINYNKEKQYYSYTDIVDCINENSAVTDEDMLNTLALANQINKSYNELVMNEKWCAEILEEKAYALEEKKKEFLEEDCTKNVSKLIAFIKEDELVLERLQKAVPAIKERLIHLEKLKEVMSQAPSATKVLNSFSQRDELWEIFGKKEIRPTDEYGYTKIKLK